MFIRTAIIASLYTKVAGAQKVIQPVGISGFFLWLFLKERQRRKSKATNP
jgi:hypothetical protein